MLDVEYRVNCSVKRLYITVLTKTFNQQHPLYRQSTCSIVVSMKLILAIAFLAAALVGAAPVDTDGMHLHSRLVHFDTHIQPAPAVPADDAPNPLMEATRDD